MHGHHRPPVLAAAALAVALAARPAEAQTPLVPGDVAIVGWVDNGTPNDVFTIVTLADLPAGTTVYFTDNGWDDVAGAFRNPNGPTDGDGGEQLLKFEAVTTLPAGTILSTTDTGAAFKWTATGTIPGATTGSFGSLVLTQTGDQICAFQHDTGTNPLNTPVMTPLFVLDDTGSFETASSTTTGGVPSGLAAAAHTALAFAQSGSSQNFMGFRTNAMPAGTKAQWLAAIADPANWTFATSGVLPAGTIHVTNGAITSYCAGDGTLASACPCANAGLQGRGCDNSSATGGALLVASGSTSANSIVLITSGENASALSIFLQGDASIAGGVPFGDGLRCVGGALRKLATRNAVGGSAVFPLPGDPSIPAAALALGDPLPAGSTRYYQVYYRDAVLGYCDAPLGNAWNVTNALEIGW